MVKYQILIGGEDYTKYCALPFKEQYVLDSALDNGVLTLPMTNRNEIFKPFTPVDITKDGETYRMYVASDKMTEIVGSGKYTHELVLIEETKLLEKKVVDTNTTTQPLIHDYLGTSGWCYISTDADLGDRYSSVYKTPIEKGTTLNILSANEWWSTDYPDSVAGTSGSFEITSPSGQVTTVSDFNTSLDYTFNEVGTYTIKYVVNIFILVVVTETSYINIEVMEQQEPRKTKSITDVVNRLLAITETLRASETPKLKFNQEQADFYDQRKQTWLINDTPDVSTDFSYDISFTSNGANYTKISVTAGLVGILKYDTTQVYDDFSAYWQNNNYKTITFNEKIPDELKTWLNANATLTNEELLYPAPEFSMTKSTLRECLDQVGSYIHSIVRLVGDTIYFDKLGGTNETTLEEDYIGNYETLDCEQYASQLDSIVSNLTNIDDVFTGTIQEPFAAAYKTVRAETGTIRIGDGGNESTAIIETDYPIEKIAKLYCGFITVGGNDILVGDITPYVYEKAEYDLLSSNTGTYPLSKGYAITYTQGQKNITGLLFKLPNAVSSIFSKPAILNIISQKIGQSVQGLFNVQDITELQFRLVYYPSTTARVKQSRTDINNYSMELTSIYNQSANKVDSRAYGENLKGAIARLGNIDKFITYTKKNTTWVINDNPDIDGNLDVSINFTSNNGQQYTRIRTSEGNLWYYQGNTRTSVYTVFGEMWNPDGDFKEVIFNGTMTTELLNWLENNATLKNYLLNVGDYVIINNEDYYIATLSVENQLDYTKYTVGLSKDFNALSKYIGIKNNIRLYEVSEKQSVERYVTYEDYCVIGNAIESDDLQLITNAGINRIKNQFTNISDIPITVARVQGTDVDGNSLTEVDLPVISLGLGNSIWLGFKYVDNYSAGNQSVDPSSDNTGAYYRLNQFVRYTDYFGEIEKLSIKMYDYYTTITNKTEAINVGNSLPEATMTASPLGLYISTNNNDIVIKKDNREQINFSYQMHFVTNNNIIIGSQLAQGNTFVSSEQNYARLYILPNRINKFTSKIDLSGATFVTNASGKVHYNSITHTIDWDDITATASGKSWAWVDKDGKLLFGKNIAIENGDTIEMPVMTFTHKI